MVKKVDNKQNNRLRKSMFDSFSSWLFRSLRTGFFGFVFTSYDKSNNRFLAFVKAKKAKRKPKDRNIVAYRVEENNLVNALPKARDFFLNVAMKNYAIILALIGITMIGLYFLSPYANLLNTPFHMIVTGVVCMIISVLMFLSKSSLASFVIKTKLLRIILVSFMGFDEENFRNVSKKEPFSSTSISLLLGIAFAAISYFVGPAAVATFILAVIMLYQTILSPEIGVIIILLALPFASPLVFSIFCLVVFGCYLAKYIMGKRVFKVELMDLFYLILLPVLIYGVAISSNVKTSFTMFLVTLPILIVFVIIPNLIRNTEWFKRTFIAIAISSGIASIIGIVQFIFSFFNITWSKIRWFEEIHRRPNSTFDNYEAFAIFLAASLAITFTLLFTKKEIPLRIIGGVASLLNLTALVMTRSRAGFLGAIVMIAIFLIVHHRNSIYLIAISSAVIVILRFSLPSNFINYVYTLTKTETNVSSYRGPLLESVGNMIKNHIMGVGMGKEAFSKAYLPYAPEGYENVNSAANLYQGLFAVFGVVFFIFLLIVLFIFLRMVFSFCAKKLSRDDRMDAMSGFCGMVAIFASGFLYYSFYDLSILEMLVICATLSYTYVKNERIENVPIDTQVDIYKASIDIKIDDDYKTKKVEARMYVHAPRKKSKKEITPEEDLEKTLKGIEIEIPKQIVEENERKRRRKSSKKNEGDK